MDSGIWNSFRRYQKTIVIWNPSPKFQNIKIRTTSWNRFCCCWKLMIFWYKYLFLLLETDDFMSDVFLFLLRHICLEFLYTWNENMKMAIQVAHGLSSPHPVWRKRWMWRKKSHGICKNVHDIPLKLWLVSLGSLRHGFNWHFIPLKKPKTTRVLITKKSLGMCKKPMDNKKQKDLKLLEPPKWLVVWSVCFGGGSKYESWPEVALDVYRALTKSTKNLWKHKASKSWNLKLSSIGSVTKWFCWATKKLKQGNSWLSNRQRIKIGW